MLGAPIGDDRLFKSHALPFPANDQIANFSCALPFFRQLVDKEALLETELSAGAVVCRETIKQAAMAETGVAVAITRLLCKQFGILPGVPVSPGNHRIGKLFGIENFRKRPGIIDGLEEGRNSRGRHNSSRMIALGFLG